MQLKNQDKEFPTILQPLITTPGLPLHEHVKLELAVRKIKGVTLSKPYNINRSKGAISRALKGDEALREVLYRIILFINRFDKKNQLKIHP